MRDLKETPVYHRRPEPLHRHPNYDTDDGPETRLTPELREYLTSHHLSLFRAAKRAGRKHTTLLAYCGFKDPLSESSPEQRPLP